MRFELACSSYIYLYTYEVDAIHLSRSPFSLSPPPLSVSSIPINLTIDRPANPIKPLISLPNTLYRLSKTIQSCGAFIQIPDMIEAAVPPELSLAGCWLPLQKILYGTVLFPFVPINLDPKGKGRLITSDTPSELSVDASDDPERQPVPANPHQVREASHPRNGPSDH